VLPLFSLIVLFVPFPARRSLTGGRRCRRCPARSARSCGSSWAVLQVWTLWQSRLITARPIERWSLTSIAIARLRRRHAVAGLAAQKLTGTSLFPSGDEPHYLVIAQSLWRDGDLKIENNHERGDYREYYTSDLEPHYLTRGTDGEIYSIHPIGIAVILAPSTRSAATRGRSWFLIALGALALAIAWRWTVQTLNAPGAATFAWAAIALVGAVHVQILHDYPRTPRGWR
jgi:hypothetical protein